MAAASFLVGMGQIRVEFGQVGPNLARAVKAIEEAAARGCRMVVLPECLDLGWTFPEAPRLAEPVPGPRSDVLAEAAARCAVYVAAGLTERAGDRIYNAAVLIGDRGELLAKHRKINELVIGQELYATGDRLGVVETPLGAVGMNICADNFPDSLVLGHALARMGCQLLVSPCAWAVQAGHDNAREPYGELWLGSYTALARLYDLTVIGVSSVGWLTGGPWKGKKCIGASLAVGPGGRVLARGPYGETAEAVVPVEVTLQPRRVRGAAIAEMLRARGYTGP
jgi:predicted amidohydrolase